jgi:magnesium transporter
MFRVCDVRSGTAVQIALGDDRVSRPPQGTVRWIDLVAPTADELALLGARFGFHPLTLEDCSHQDQRPKLEEYEGYFFIVIHGFVCNKEDPAEVEPRELHSFLGEHFLVTVHDEPLPALDSIWDRVEKDPAISARDADYFYYLVADRVVDANFDLLDVLSEAIDAVEEAILERTRPIALPDIFKLKRALVEMRRALSPQRDVFAILAKRGGAHVSERTSLYFRDVYDHLVRIYESIDAGRDLLGNALEAYLSASSQRTNEIMKRLTILSAIFLPLAFVTGFFGQNFEHLPFGSDALMYTMICACVVIPGGMLWWFHRSKWF